MQTQILTGNGRGLKIFAHPFSTPLQVNDWLRHWFLLQSHVGDLVACRLTADSTRYSTVHSGYATSPYRPIWSVAVCATDVTDVSKDYKWLLALQCTKTAENIAGNV